MADKSCAELFPKIHKQCTFLFLSFSVYSNSTNYWSQFALILDLENSARLNRAVCTWAKNQKHLVYWHWIMIPSTSFQASHGKVNRLLIKTQWMWDKCWKLFVRLMLNWSIAASKYFCIRVLTFVRVFHAMDNYHCISFSAEKEEKINLSIISIATAQRTFYFVGAQCHSMFMNL